jgi:hypothetical protein
LLVKAGIDINIKVLAGETALHKGNFKINQNIENI